jgi:hypothetical protein
MDGRVNKAIGGYVVKFPSGMSIHFNDEQLKAI